MPPFAEPAPTSSKDSGALLPDLPIDQGTDLSPADLSKLGIDAETLKGLGIDLSKQGEGKKEVPKQAKRPAKDKSLDNPHDILKKMRGEDEDQEESDQTESFDQESDSDQPEGEEEGEETEEADSYQEFEIKGKKVRLDREQLREAVEKSMDYTKKTQMLSKMKKEFDQFQKQTMAELEETTKELEARYGKSQEKLEQLDTWDNAIEILKEDNPELYDQLFDFMRGYNRQYRNPRNDKHYQMLKSEIESLKKGNESREYESIRQGYQREMNDLQSQLGTQLKELGLNPNWEKVKQAWIQSDGSVQEAFYKVYGDHIVKLYHSKGKTNRVMAENRGKQNPLGISKRNGQVQRGGINSKDLKKMGWGELTSKLLG